MAILRAVVEVDVGVLLVRGGLKGVFLLCHHQQPKAHRMKGRFANLKNHQMRSQPDSPVLLVSLPFVDANAFRTDHKTVLWNDSVHYSVGM